MVSTPAPLPLPTPPVFTEPPNSPAAQALAQLLHQATQRPCPASHSAQPLQPCAAVAHDDVNRAAQDLAQPLSQRLRAVMMQVVADGGCGDAHQLSARLNEDEAIVHAFSTEQLRQARVSDATFARAEQHLGRLGVLALSSLNAYYRLGFSLGVSGPLRQAQEQAQVLAPARPQPQSAAG